MERLTTRSRGPLPVLVRGRAFGPAYFMSEQDYEDYRDALNKLAAYEDTGLEPQTISEILDSVSEWYDAHKEGRLLVLPCKVGDTAWRIFNGEITRLTIVSVSFSDQIKPRVLVVCLPFCRFYWNDVFGKTVFRTREEAEAALKERENDG